MPVIDFAQFAYYPDLLCSYGEHEGYNHLNDEDKDSIIPIFELSQRSHEPNLNGSIELIRRTSNGRPFILDLCKNPAPPPFVSNNPQTQAEMRDRIEEQRAAQEEYNSELAQLLDPSNGFSAWRQLVNEFPASVPVLQYTDANRESLDLLRQAALLARDDRSLAIRITQESDPVIYSTVAQIISILDSPDRLLLIIDCGQGRLRRAEREDFVRRAISSITRDFDVAQRSAIRGVCLSSSFPNLNNDGLRHYAGYDWEIWDEVRGVFPFMFGDYAATYRKRSSSTYIPGDWRSTVVYPLDEGWLAYRHLDANDRSGWTSGAAETMEHDLYEPTEIPCWGADMLERAAEGDTEGVESARFWYAAKVNMHIHRQIQVAAANIFGIEDDDEELE